ncbi:MAG: threonine synthase, partial [Clostridia bacterium]|nr:threonine synthase [Clostridia bacterium]
LSGRNDEVIRDLMKSLSDTGRYEIPVDMMASIRDLFYAGCCDDEEAAATIRNTFEKHNYLLDTHTAVAVKVYADYKAETGDETPTVIASTANPYKFSASVLEAVGGNTAELDEFQKVEALNAKTACEVPAPLASLRGKTVRFDQVCDRDKAAMRQVVFGMLNITE